MKDPFDPFGDGIEPYPRQGGKYRALEAEKKLKELEDKIVSWIAGFMDDQGEPEYATMIREGKWKEELLNR